MEYATFSSFNWANSFRNLPRLSSSRRSSASSQKIHSPVAWRRLSLRAAAKLSTQGKSKTRAPKPAASSLVLSVEPVSTTIISSTRSRAEPRQAGRFASSFLTITHKDTPGRFAVRRGVAGVGTEAVMCRLSRRIGFVRNSRSRASTTSAAWPQVKRARMCSQPSFPCARASSG